VWVQLRRCKGAAHGLWLAHGLGSTLTVLRLFGEGVGGGWGGVRKRCCTSGSGLIKPTLVRHGLKLSATGVLLRPSDKPPLPPSLALLK
jgi:hypothetical protein